MERHCPTTIVTVLPHAFPYSNILCSRWYGLERELRRQLTDEARTESSNKSCQGRAQCKKRSTIIQHRENNSERQTEIR
jgi:hypothetical protein